MPGRGRDGERHVHSVQRGAVVPAAAARANCVLFVPTTGVPGPDVELRPGADRRILMRRLIWLAAPAAGLLATALAVPSSGATSNDRTAPYGPLGVTTTGMGPGPSYGEPSFAWAPDGRHGIICTPGDDG